MRKTILLILFSALLTLATQALAGENSDSIQAKLREIDNTVLTVRLEHLPDEVNNFSSITIPNIKDEIKYDNDRQELSCKGPMYLYKKQVLLDLSSDKAYQNAVKTLYKLSLPLAIHWHQLILEENPNNEGLVAHFYLQHDLFDLAIKHYTEALKLNPKSPRLHTGIARAYDAKGKYDLAIKEYKEAIRIKPDYVEAYYSLGIVYGKKGLYDLAIRQYKECILIKPDYADAHYYLGVMYSLKGQNDLATKHTEQALLLDPNNKPASELLDVLYRRKRGY